MIVHMTTKPTYEPKESNDNDSGAFFRDDASIWSQLCIRCQYYRGYEMKPVSVEEYSDDTRYSMMFIVYCVKSTKISVCIKY